MYSWRLAKIAVMAYASLAIAACGAVSHKRLPRAAASPLPRGMVRQDLASATVKVKAIDLKTHQVTLERQDGSLMEVLGGDEEQNLDRVGVGDSVTVTYYESVAYEVMKPSNGAPGLSLVQRPGQPGLVKPGAVQMQVTTVAVPIADIDVAAHTLTLRAPDGKLTTFTAREDLSEVAVGDLVDITYTTALAISMDTPVSR
jgi:hypothetical protein